MRLPHSYLLAALLTLGAATACRKKAAETQPARRDVTETVFASGELEAEDTYHLTAQVDGYLNQVDFEQGDTVSPNALLARIDNQENAFNQTSAKALYQISAENTQPGAPALAQAEAAIANTKAKLRQDSAQERRYYRLWQANSIARVDYESMALQYQTSKTNLTSASEAYRLQARQALQALISSQALKQVSANLARYNQVRSLLGGRIYEKRKWLGDYVRKGDVIALIGRPGALYAKVSVDEANISRIRQGQVAQVALNTDPKKVYAARVALLYPTFDEASQAFICKLVFGPPLQAAIRGTQVQANIVVAQYRQALVIPRAYLDWGGRVQVKGEDKPRTIKTGFIGTDWVQVLSGISPGQTLVTENLPENNVKPSEAGAAMR